MKIIVVTLLNGPKYEMDLSAVSPQAVLQPLTSPVLHQIIMNIASMGIQHPDKPCAWIAPATIAEVEIISEDKSLTINK